MKGIMILRLAGYSLPNSFLYFLCLPIAQIVIGAHPTIKNTSARRERQESGEACFSTRRLTSPTTRHDGIGYPSQNLGRVVRARHEFEEAATGDTSLACSSGAEVPKRQMGMEVDEFEELNQGYKVRLRLGGLSQ